MRLQLEGDAVSEAGAGGAVWSTNVVVVVVLAGVVVLVVVVVVVVVAGGHPTRNTATHTIAINLPAVIVVTTSAGSAKGEPTSSEREPRRLSRPSARHHRRDPGGARTIVC